jgi:hypothetical protein
LVGVGVCVGVSVGVFVAVGVCVYVGVDVGVLVAAGPRILTDPFDMDGVIVSFIRVRPELKARETVPPGALSLTLSLYCTIVPDPLTCGAAPRAAVTRHRAAFTAEVQDEQSDPTLALTYSSESDGICIPTLKESMPEASSMPTETVISSPGDAERLGRESV